VKYFLVVKMVYTNEVKFFVLDKILTKKEVLFGKFSDKLTKQDKVNAWKEVFESVQCLNAFPGKDYTYLRDVFYQNSRKTI
jgi:hypothetical protein